MLRKLQAPAKTKRKKKEKKLNMKQRKNYAN